MELKRKSRASRPLPELHLKDLGKKQRDDLLRAQAGERGYAADLSLKGRKPAFTNVAQSWDRFLEAWSRLNTDERNWIIGQMAQQVDPKLGDADREFFLASIANFEPTWLPVTQAATALAAESTLPARGQPLSPGGRQLVLAAYRIWLTTTGDSRLGKLRNRQGEWKPYPIAKFVAEVVRKYAPEVHSAADSEAGKEQLCITYSHNMLAELDRAGALEGRKTFVAPATVPDPAFEAVR